MSYKRGLLDLGIQRQSEAKKKKKKKLKQGDSFFSNFFSFVIRCCWAMIVLYTFHCKVIAPTSIHLARFTVSPFF